MVRMAQMEKESEKGLKILAYWKGVKVTIHIRWLQRQGGINVLFFRITT